MTMTMEQPSSQSAAFPRHARAISYLSWLFLGSIAALQAACVTLRPLPPAGQPIAQASAADVVVSVPRLDDSDYPADVLSLYSPVLVTIENRGAREILVDPQSFTLGAAGGEQLRPMPPQLSLRESLTRPGQPEPVLLAAAGARFVAPPRATVRVGPPVWHGRYYLPRSYPRSFGRWGWWSSGPLYWGVGPGLAWYGSPAFWPWFYDGPSAYYYSRLEAMRLALPASRLPPGARTGGFLYFPRRDYPRGTQLMLTWPIQESTSRQDLGTVQVQLEVAD